MGSVESPDVALDPRPFPITTTFALKSVPIDAAVNERVRNAVQFYLHQLRWYREDGNVNNLPITGRFAEVVKAGLDATDASGIERTLVLESLVVERYLVKPWGVPALAEARVTIVDTAKDRSAPDERETGRLRLTGDRLFVVDGWDAANQRWYNDEKTTRLEETSVRRYVIDPIKNHLRIESWAGGSAAESGFGPSQEDPYTKARSAYLKLLDRSKVSRLFSDVTARIEKLETFPDLPEGLVTVRLMGKVTTIDLQARAETQTFERTVVVAITSSLHTIVDEQVSPGVWMSGGDLMSVLREWDRTLA